MRQSLGDPPPARRAARDREPDDRRAARPGSEQALHAEYLAQARADPDAFAARCAELLAEGGTLAEKAAALRAWYDAELEPRYRAFALALAEPSTETEVREFALRFTAGKAPADAAARQVLADHLASGAADLRGRCLAVYPVLRWGDEREVGACGSLLFLEVEPGVVTRAAEALRLSQARNAPTLLADLRRGHPRPAVREALAKE